MDNPYVVYSIRLIVAMLLGGIIGLEREYRSKDAGFRTHFLVALGAALFTLLSMYGFTDGVKDTSRVAAQVVSGIGFLGAGLIVFQRNVVRGLTTAAGLWVTAAVGMACGVGQYYMAILVTILMLVGLEAMRHLLPRLSTATVQVSFSSPSVTNARQAVSEIRKRADAVYSYEMVSKHTSGGELYEVHMEVKIKRSTHVDPLLEVLEQFDDVMISNVE